MFHPRGLVYAGEVRSVAEEPRAQALAARLAGPALVRFSSAIWKRREWPDVLGCALRFGDAPRDSTVREGDQDLLFATIRRPWTMPFAPLSTRFRDYLANAYFAVSPFQAEGLGRVEFLLRPRAAGARDGTRSDRLAAACRTGEAELTLLYAPYRPPWRAFDERSFRPLVELKLREKLAGEGSALDTDLAFDPFRTGRGIVPRGLIHALRIGVYRASQRARAVQAREG